MQSYLDILVIYLFQNPGPSVNLTWLSTMLLFLQFGLPSFSGFSHDWSSGQIRVIKEKGLSPAKLSVEAAEVSKMSNDFDICANCHFCPQVLVLQDYGLPI